MPRQLTENEVTALFAGKLDYVAPVKQLSLRTRAWQARYDRCDNCTVMQPCLITFDGHENWSPSLPLNDSLWTVVNGLRDELAKRTILLCSHCITEHRGKQPTAVSAVTTLRLFED